jgi:hypothetical protein
VSEFPDRLKEIAARVRDAREPLVRQLLTVELERVAGELEERLDAYTELASKLLETLEAHKLAVRFSPRPAEAEANRLLRGG